MNALESLAASVSVRPHLAAPHAEAMAAYTAAVVLVAEKSAALNEALERYKRAPSDEQLRQRLRAAGAELSQAHTAVALTGAETANALDNLRKADHAIALAVRGVHHPDRIAAAAPTTAIECMSANLAQAAASGQPDVAELRAFLARVDANNEASAYLRTEGTVCPNVHQGLFFLPLFEALAVRGVFVNGAPWAADYLPSMQALALRDWCEAHSDKADRLRPELAARAASIASHQREYAQIRRACADGVRTWHEYTRWQARQTGELAAPALPPSPGSGGRPVQAPAGYYPSGAEPTRSKPGASPAADAIERNRASLPPFARGGTT